MAGENTDKETLGKLDFGIEETVNAGDATVLNFLTGNESAKDDDLEEIDESSSSTTTPKTTVEAKKPFQNNSKNKKDADPKKDAITSQEVTDALETGDDDDEGENTDDSTQGDDNQEDTTGAEGDNTYELLGKDLLKLGVFTKDEDGEDVVIKTPQELLSRFRYEQKKQLANAFDNFLNRFGQDYRDMFDAVYVDGVNPKDYLLSYTKLADVANLDLSVETNQERVYREYFKRQGIADDRIEARLQKTKSYGDLEDEVKDFHKILVDQDAAELETLKNEADRKTALQKKQDSEFAKASNDLLVEKVKEKDFDGIPLSDQIAREAFDFLNNKKYKTPDGQLLTEYDKFMMELKDPKNSALKVKLALLALNKFDLSKIKVKEKNQKVEELFSFAKKDSNNKKTNNKNNKAAAAADNFF